MMPPPAWRPARLLPAVAAFALLGPGCGKGPACYPVKGQVLVGGQPANGALVVFVPEAAAGGAAGNTAPRPSGTVGADGSFTLHTYDTETRTSQDGAPPGAYVVTVVWTPENAREIAQTNPRAEAPDKLKGRYADPKTSTLRATVKEGHNDLPPFQLEAGPKSGKR